MSERFPQQKEFQELPGRRGRAHTPPLSVPCIHSRGTLGAATNFHICPGDHGGGETKSQRRVRLQPSPFLPGASLPVPSPGRQPLIPGPRTRGPRTASPHEGRTPDAPWSCSLIRKTQACPDRSRSRGRMAILQGLGTEGLSWGGDPQTTVGTARKARPRDSCAACMRR